MSPKSTWDSGPHICATFYVNARFITTIKLAPSPLFSCKIVGGYLQDEILKWMEAYSTKSLLPALPFDLSPFPAFTQLALQAIHSIPFGTIQSYQSLAQSIGNPYAARAIGSACRKNPYPLIIPCHRVVNSNGRLGGFAYGLKMKQDMLHFEETSQLCAL